MPNYHLNGNCVSPDSLLSNDVHGSPPVMIDPDSMLLFAYNSISPAAGPDDLLISYWYVFNTTSGAYERTVATNQAVRECTDLGPIDQPHAFSFSSGLAIPSIVLVLFWLGRIAGKQK